MNLVVRTTVENLWGRVEYLSPQESALGTHTALWGSVRAPSGFSSGKPLGTAPPQFCILRFSLRKSLGGLHTDLSAVSPPSTFLRGQFSPTALGFSTVALRLHCILHPFTLMVVYNDDQEVVVVQITIPRYNLAGQALPDHDHLAPCGDHLTQGGNEVSV